ncbi:18S rRNA (guanine-N(7))-methyltransferase RID2 [Physcia stellaris]|nr:18S rRNA (guanine-N(7))-methyltransferase RID2 [Physcia stellaris]
MRAKLSGSDERVRSRVITDAVLGELDLHSISKTLQEKCGATPLRIDASTGSFAIDDQARPRVISLDFPPLPAGRGKKSRLLEHDAFLASVIDYLPGSEYTVIYSTTPSATTHHPVTTEAETYEMDTNFGVPLHMELKRDLSNHRRESSNITLPNAPLFEKYQFFSPGIFMGLVVSLVLFSIIYVAISGISSLQVSYAAFDKEMGPAAQKKQQ